jgi:hypothetical protein
MIKEAMEDITIIIPLKEFTEEMHTYAKRAFETIPEAVSKVLFVGPQDICTEAIAFYKENHIGELPITAVVVNNDTDVYTQINKAVFACTTPYFSILEFDDAYTNIWFDEFLRYQEYNQDVAVYLPIVELVNTDDKIVGFENEIAWATSFSGDELGYLDTDCLMSFMDFNVTGSIIKTEDFISVGGLKPSMLIAAWYEFLLRVTNNGKNIYVVPKAGYRHTVNREGSYLTEAIKDITSEHGKWLIDTAREEYKYKESRNLAFTPNTKEE